jgi:hypothetical protein
VRIFGKRSCEIFFFFKTFQIYVIFDLSITSQLVEGEFAAHSRAMLLKKLQFFSIHLLAAHELITHMIVMPKNLMNSKVGGIFLSLTSDKDKKSCCHHANKRMNSSFYCSKIYTQS